MRRADRVTYLLQQITQQERARLPQLAEVAAVLEDIYLNEPPKYLPLHTLKNLVSVSVTFITVSSTVVAASVSFVCSFALFLHKIPLFSRTLEDSACIRVGSLHSDVRFV